MFRGFHTVDIFDCPPFQMFTNGDDPCSAAILEGGSLEPHSMRLWCRLARTASSIIDVGAHVGVYSLAAAALRKDIQIHAFEPNPFTAARLRVNKHLNDFQHITEHNIALAENAGIANILWGTKPGGWLSSGSSLLGLETWQKAPVYVKTLDSFDIQPGATPLLKIDVEGGEYNVFRGMPRFLSSRPAIILETFAPHACDYINQTLTGYKVFLIDEGGSLVQQDKLSPRRTSDQNKNQLLWPEERGSP
jgi:FkbM family methyltransferase